MHIHDIAFYASGFFLIGVFLSSLGLDFFVVAFTTLLLVSIFLFVLFVCEPAYLPQQSVWLAGLSFFIIVGAGYYVLYDARQHARVSFPLDELISVEGTVVSHPARGDTQQFMLLLHAPYAGKVHVFASSYPEVRYGDVISFEDAVSAPEPEGYAHYLAKNDVFGVVSFPEITVVDVNHGNTIKNFLYTAKDRILSHFITTLPSQEAAFLGGITLGERAQFSNEFKEAMSISGTTHLVALSGYNITILAVAMFALFNRFVSRRVTFWLTIAVIVGFVVMTGAEPSVVRAAIMGFIVLLAEQVGRVRSMRNAIVIAALIMVLFNPKVLYFDVGFQLSFLALLGIIYVAPVLKRLLSFPDDDGILAWRKNLVTTTSAQLAVAPLLILNFDQFSLTSLVANVLILEAIPYTMFLGFVIGALGFVSFALAQVVAWFTHVLLAYELFIIELFAELALPFSLMNVFGAVVYYAIGAAFVFWHLRRMHVRL